MSDAAIVSIAIDDMYKGFLGRREATARRMKRNLDKVAYWKKQYDKATDLTVAKETKERLEKALSITKDNGVTLKKATTKDFYAYRKATYSRGDVNFDLVVVPTVNVSGVCLSFHKERKGDYYGTPLGKRVLRIFVGKETRVTNNILQTLLGDHTE